MRDNPDNPVKKTHAGISPRHATSRYGNGTGWFFATKIAKTQRLCELCVLCGSHYLIAGKIGLWGGNVAGACEARFFIGFLPCRPKGVSVCSVVNDPSCVRVNVPHSVPRRGRRGAFARHFTDHSEVKSQNRSVSNLKMRFLCVIKSIHHIIHKKN